MSLIPNFSFLTLLYYGSMTNFSYCTSLSAPSNLLRVLFTFSSLPSDFFHFTNFSSNQLLYAGVHEKTFITTKSLKSYVCNCQEISQEESSIMHHVLQYSRIKYSKLDKSETLYNQLMKRKWLNSEQLQKIVTHQSTSLKIRRSYSPLTN